jgi:hypothetical protein
MRIQGTTTTAIGDIQSGDMDSVMLIIRQQRVEMIQNRLDTLTNEFQDCVDQSKLIDPILGRLDTLRKFVMSHGGATTWSDHHDERAQKVLDFKMSLSPAEQKLVAEAFVDEQKKLSDNPGLQAAFAREFIFDGDQNKQANFIDLLTGQLRTKQEDLKGKMESLKSDIQQASDDLQSELRAMSRSMHKSHNTRLDILQAE